MTEISISDYRCPWAIFARDGGGEGWGRGAEHWSGGKTWHKISLWMLQGAAPSGHLTHVCLCRCDLGGRDELHELGEACILFLHMTCMYAPPHMSCMYPPPHMTCMLHELGQALERYFFTHLPRPPPPCLRQVAPAARVLGAVTLTLVCMILGKSPPPPLLGGFGCCTDGRGCVARASQGGGEGGGGGGGGG